VSGRVLLFGASSGIGGALARRLAAEGYDMILAGRDKDDLASRARDLEVRYGVATEVVLFDALDFDSHPGLIEACFQAAPRGLEGVAVCHGAMSEPEAAVSDFATARHMIDVNYASVVSLLDRAAEHFERQQRGFLCVVTSVAGDRGRASNYHYGSSKAALSVYLEGLGVRLGRAGVKVVDVRPGMVDTRLTYGLPGLVLVAQPETVAADAWRAIRTGRSVVYSPWFWRVIMGIIKLLPNFVFKRLPL
jgi:decaprenylphospho-beta-D-erythro-pentofuranosid-2-ulose 2-reductase